MSERSGIEDADLEASPMIAGNLVQPVDAPLPVRARVATRQEALSLVLNADRIWLPGLLIFFGLKQILSVFLYGPFSGHDEVDHFWYVQRLADGYGLGVVGKVELPPAAGMYAQYVADYPLNSEVIQPPLYHLGLAVLGNLVPGDMLATLYLYRLVSVALGVVVVWLCYLIARELFPRDASVRIGVPVFVALQPQFAFESAIVNHDILVILLATLGCYLTFRGVRSGFSWRLALAIGLVSAAGLWTKVSFGLILPVFGAGLLIGATDQLRSFPSHRSGIPLLARQTAVRGLLMLGVPVLAIAPWFVRNLDLYGDPTGSARLGEVSDYALSASTYPEMVTSPVFWRGRLDDFWGNYGWREIPWDNVTSLVVYLCWGVAALGALALLIRQLASLRCRTLDPVLDGYQSRCLALTVLAVGLMIFAVLYVGTLQFTQSRFAFPAMFGFALLTVLGFGAWVPARWRWVIPIVLFVTLVILNILVAVEFVIPYYVGPGGGQMVLPGGTT